MRKFFASVLVIIAIFYLTALLVITSILNNAKNPDFYVKAVRSADLYSSLINYISGSVSDTFGNAFAGSFDVSKSIEFSKNVMPQSLFESKIHDLTTNVVDWFESDKKVEDLSLSINLSEVADNVASSANILFGSIPTSVSASLSNVIPKSIDIKELIDPSTESMMEIQLLKARGYYKLAFGMRILLWGAFAVLIMFIVLLRIPYLSSILKYVGVVGIFNGILSIVIGFVLPTVAGIFMKETIANTEAVKSILSSVLFNIGITGVGIFALGLILVIFGKIIKK